MIGIGSATRRNLSRIGVDTIGELAALPLETLKIRMGKHGESLWYFANGLDSSKVLPQDCDMPIKSIGKGITGGA